MKIPWVIANGLGLAAILFGAGFLTGREFPTHHYTRFGDTGRLLLYPDTGRVCDPLNDPTAKPVMVPAGPPDLMVFNL